MTETVLAPEIFGRLRQATTDKPDVLAELCRDYLAEARSTIEQLRHALAMNDASALRERAHYLKGSSMMIGASGLSRCCATLEQMGRDSKLEEAEGMLDQAIAALRAVEGQLSAEVGPIVLPV